MRILAVNFFLLCALGLLANPEARAYSRIVTLTPLISEWVSEIITEPLTLKTLVGASEYSNYPAALKKIETVGPYPHVNVEKIAALHPDLVIGQENSNAGAQIEQLKRLKLNVVLVSPETFLGMSTWIQSLGKILGEEKNAKRTSERWVNEVNELKLRKPKKSRTVFFEIQHDPLITIGGASFLNEALAAVGYENIEGSLSQAYPKVSKESVIKAKPDVVFIMDLSGKPEDFLPSKRDWEKYGLQIRTVSGDDFARCSFSLLHALKGL